MSFINRIIGMITKPDEATKEIAAEPRIEESLLIVGIYMLLLIIGAYISYSHIQYIGTIAGMDIATFKTVTLFSGIIGVVLMTLIGWPIIAGVVHVLSMFFGGDGKFWPTLMTLIGYTAIPLIFVSIIAIIVGLFTPVTIVDLSNIAATRSVTSGLLGSPLAIISAVITLLGSLWTAYMMAYAVKNGEKLAMNNAYIIVGILFIANLALTFGSIVLALLST